MTKIQFGANRASRPHGFMQFLLMAIRILVFPVDTYRIINNQQQYIEVPGRSLTDAKQMLLFGFSHLEYGVTFIYDGRYVKIAEVGGLIREERERRQRLQALIGSPQ